MSKTHVTHSGYLKPNKTITPEVLSLRGYCYFDRKYIPHNMQGLYLRVMYLGVYFSQRRCLRFFQFIQIIVVSVKIVSLRLIIFTQATILS